MTIKDTSNKGMQAKLKEAIRSYPEDKFTTSDIIRVEATFFSINFDTRRHSLQSLCSHLVRSGYLLSHGKIGDPIKHGKGAKIVQYEKTEKLKGVTSAAEITIPLRGGKKQVTKPKRKVVQGKHTTLDPSKAHKPIQSLDGMLTQFGEDSVYQADFVRAFNNELTRVYDLIERLHLELRTAKSDLRKANKSLSQISNQYKDELAELRTAVDARATGFKMSEIVRRRPDVEKIEKEIGVNRHEPVI